MRGQYGAKTVSAGGRKYVYYVCSAHKQDKSCQPHRIRDTELEDMVLAALQSYIRQVVDLDALLDATDTVPLRTAEVRKLQRRLDACKVELERANRLLLSLYENLTDGIISREEYNLLKQNYSQRTSDAERQMNDLQDAIRSVQEKDRCGQSWIGQFHKHENLTELERATVVTLIDRILVYAGKQVEIRYRWQDEFAWQLDLLRQTRAKEAV